MASIAASSGAAKPPAAEDDLEQTPSRKKIRNNTGHFVPISGLAVPENVKKVLEEMDLHGNGEVDEEDIANCIRVFKGLKEGLDVDGSGNVSMDHIEEAIDLLSNLAKEKHADGPEMAYGHMPTRIKEIMKDWDADGSGKVNAGELAAAAKAYKKVKDQGRRMQKIILALSLIILLLMASMFVLSWAAVELAKEMRGNHEGVMTTPSGAVVKVASSDFQVLPDGSLATRGPGNSSNSSGPGALKVSASESSRRLSSTLPDATFKELKSVTLKDKRGQGLKLTITSFQRLSLRSSKCGSVVHLTGDQGRLTLDDYDMTADDKLQAYAQSAGMGDLFQGPVSGFGRRLAADDGMLEGFFNLLDDVDWKCESVALPNPKDLPHFYLARVQVRHLHENPEDAFSTTFVSPEAEAIALAGVEIVGGRAYKVWQEDLLMVGRVTGIRSTYGMNPFTREVRLQQGGVELRVEETSGIGFGCSVADAGPTTIGSAQANTDGPSMEFVGVTVEGGVSLRQWRMHTMKEGDERNVDPLVRAMLEQGMIPTVMDYFDVDTDPSGAFEPGHPFRIRMYSDVPGSKVDTVKQYLSITPLPAALEASGVLDIFNVSKLDTACAPSAAGVTNQQALWDLLNGTAGVPVTGQSQTDPTFSMPPRLSPWAEQPEPLKFVIRRIWRASERDPGSLELKAALRSTYWSDVLKYNAVAIQALLGNEAAAANANALAGVLLGRRLSTCSPDDVHSCTARISSEDHYAHQGALPAGFAGRRLAQSSRRLGAAAFTIMANLSSEAVNITVNVGAATLIYKTVYCNLVDPTLSNFPACKAGRKGSGEFVRFEASAAGSAVLYTAPSLNGSFSGSVVFDDSSALTYTDTAKVLLMPVIGQGLVLEGLWDATQAAASAATAPPTPAAPTPAPTPAPTTTTAAAPTPAPSGGTLSAAMQDILNKHNVYRCMHGVPAFTWDATIAANAQAWANNGQFQHSTPTQRTLNGVLVGENLAWGYPTQTGAQATANWYSEISYTRGGLVSSPTDATPAGAAIGHYTQVVWKASVKLGCGKGTASVNGMAGDFWVCQYGPAGNYIGDFDTNVNAPVKTEAQCTTAASPRRLQDPYATLPSGCTPNPLLPAGGLCVFGYQCASKFCCPRMKVCMPSGGGGISTSMVKVTPVSFQDTVWNIVFGGACKGPYNPGAACLMMIDGTPIVGGWNQSMCGCDYRYMQYYYNNTWVMMNDIPGLTCTGGAPPQNGGPGDTPLPTTTSTTSTTTQGPTSTRTTSTLTTTTLLPTGAVLFTGPQPHQLTDTFRDTAKWQLVFATNGNVWVRSSTGLYLKDTGYSSATLSPNKTDAERWQLRDAGSGFVYLRSLLGNYLAVQDLAPQLATPCVVKLWRKSGCLGDYMIYSSRSLLGVEMRPDDTADIYWKSTTITGACNRTEFYDASDDMPDSIKNFWQAGLTSCTNFSTAMKNSMSGVRIFGLKQSGFSGRAIVVPGAQRGIASQWKILKDDATNSPAFPWVDPKSSGTLIYDENILMSTGTSARLTNPLTAYYARNQLYGGYMAGFWHQTSVTAGTGGNTWIYVTGEMWPDQPWANKYRTWVFCMQFGYQVSTFTSVYSSDFTIYCKRLYW